jgi:ribonuclease P protein component
MPGRSLKLPKTQRLTRESEFKDVRQRGRLVRGDLFSLALLQHKSTGPLRAGIITSRRLGSAVVRNRVRRRLREIVRRHQHEVVTGTWMVVIARPRAASASYQRLEEEWLRLAGRASILTA